MNKIEEYSIYHPNTYYVSGLDDKGNGKLCNYIMNFTDVVIANFQ